MNSSNFINDNFDLWVSASKARSTSGRGRSRKSEFYGVTKLRELVLELAVGGKLVSQNSAEEPAESQLRRIAIEKEKLTSNRKTAASRKKTSTVHLESQSELPEGWSETRLGDILNVINGRAYKQNEMLQEGTPLLRVGNLFTSNEWYYSDLNLPADKYIDNGDLIYAWSASFGPFIWSGPKAIYHYHIWKLDLFSKSDVDKNYLYYYLLAITKEIKAAGSGIAMLHMTKDRMEKLVVRLPPFAEQLRISDKVAELMATCDQLEQQCETAADSHELLVETLLELMVTTQDTSLPGDIWKHVIDNFDTLITTDYAVEKLRQTILKLAVMGKLVSQNPNDEYAGRQLERVIAEKKLLIENNEIKKQKLLAEISDTEKPFALPQGWAYCRLDDICFNITSGSTPPKVEFKETEGVPYLKVYNIRDQLIDFNHKPQYVTQEYHSTKLRRSTLYPGDVVMNIVGPPLGKVAIIPDTYPEWNCNQAITFFRAIDSRYNKYIYTYLKAGLFLSSIELVGSAGQDNISTTKCRSIVLPAPPLDEQARIIHAVDKLMLFCDEISKLLRKAQATQTLIADSVLHELFGKSRQTNIGAEVKGQTMKFMTTLSINQTEFPESAVIGPILLQLGGSADAKEVWSKTQLTLPEFYAQLKAEIDANYINRPARADFSEE